jgi:hypothetical protein
MKMVQMMCSLFGTCKPIRIVQYRDSFTWSKYSQRVFPIHFSNDFSETMISEMNNVDELFRQNMTEFLQTDIDGSLDFLLSATTIHSIEKYLKTFIRLYWTLMEYHPFGIKIFKLTKQGSMLLTNYGNLQGKHQLFLFQSSRQCFISVLWNIDFVNLLWSCYSNFTFKLNLLHMIIRYFLGMNQHFLSNVFVVAKKLLLWKRWRNFYSWHLWLYVII